MEAAEYRNFLLQKNNWNSLSGAAERKNSGAEGYEGKTCSRVLLGQILAKALIGFWTIIRQNLH